ISGHSAWVVARHPSARRAGRCLALAPPRAQTCLPSLRRQLPPSEVLRNCIQCELGMERSWRAAPLLAVFAGLVLLAAGCTPKTTEPAASNTAVAPATSAAARYRRSGPQGIGASSGPIARIGA